MPSIQQRRARYQQAQVTESLQRLTGRAHVHLTGRGAAGIVAALTVWGLRGRVVALPANTCYIVLWAVLQSGCRPLLLDIDPQTGNLPAELPDFSAAERPAALIPCHLYGLPAPMAELCAWAKAQDVRVIEDAALALGGQVAGRPAGSWGDVSLFSFGSGKIIDHNIGGAVLTDDAALGRELERVCQTMPLWNEARRQRSNQWLDVYWALHQHEAANPALPALYAPLFASYADLCAYRAPADHWGGLVRALDALPEQLARREAMARRYDALIDGTRLRTIQRPPQSALWKYPLLVSAEERDGLLQEWWAQGIHEATRWYPALGRMAAALAPDVPQPPTPHAEAWAAQIINLPLIDSTD